MKGLILPKGPGRTAAESPRVGMALQETPAATPAPTDRRSARSVGQSPRTAGGPAARERLLHRLWQEQRLTSRPLSADDGSRIQVIFPGWPNGDRGPDFRGAILSTAEGRLLRGDVELHLHARDWRQHGHDQDPAYDKVVLHVAWRRGEGSPAAQTASGSPVPTVFLEGLLDMPVEALLLAGQAPRDDPRPCVRHGAPDRRDVAAVLDEEGVLRFLGKAAALAGDAAALGPEQALYRALLEALGYSKNREPFSKLAQRLPLEALRSMVAGKPPEQRQSLLQALLFGAAGLLPSQRGLQIQADPEVQELEGLWASYRQEGLTPLDWQFFRVRPENAPPRRIAAAAALVQRFLSGGLVEGLAGLMAADQGPSPVQARTALAVTVEDWYWAQHVDFGRRWRFNPTRMGGSRAADMVVNVVLPFFHSWAERRSDSRLRERCLELYRDHPPLSPNAITRQMERILLPDGAGKVVTSALRQQGLIGLYKKRCLGLLCEGCALGGR